MADLPEVRARNFLAKETEDDVCERFSSYMRLLRVMAWCRRFLNNAKTASGSREFHTLSLHTSELEQVEVLITAQAQIRNYSDEIHHLEQGREIAINSTLTQSLSWIRRASYELEVGCREPR